jgi:Fur family transcriptional regulator, ferric uptake regulator
LHPNELRNAGLKITGPRLKILEILSNSQSRHLSAIDIYRRLRESQEEIGFATVYRVLTQFSEAGLVTSHHFEGSRAVYELNEGRHHDHIVCLDCGRVQEFIDPALEARQGAVAAAHEFEIRDRAMILYGNCLQKDCPSREIDKTSKTE